jgi:hypothetical protein
MTKKLPKNDRPDLAVLQELEMTKNPISNRPSPENLVKIRQEIRLGKYSSRLRNENSWEERGPNNVAGRSRAILIDSNDESGNTVWSGSVSGGLWKSTNFRSEEASWVNQDDFFANLAISALAQHPVNPEIMFFGTGEGWFSSDAARGLGIWRSENSGQDWTQLASTNNENFYFVQKIRISPDGTIYVSTRSDGVHKSTDNGNSWVKVLGGGIGGSFSNRAGDLEIASDGKILVGMGIFSTDGIYASTNGGDSWQYLSDPSLNNGLPLDSFERVEIAVAPSNPNVFYALFQKQEEKTCLGIFYSNDSGNSWSSRPVPTAFGMDEFTRGQAWYDLSAAVDPENPAIVYIGGIDLLRSTDSGNSWEQLSQWYGSGFQYVHADQHEIIFYPNSRYEGIIANDGGIASFKIDPEVNTNVGPSYCPPTHFQCCSDYITNVTLNDINNNSTNPTSIFVNGYSDFTSVSTSLEAGKSYDIRVTSNLSWDDSKTGVWIDWDQNGEFTENENILSTSGKSPYSVNFEVPSDAFHGNTRMRVRLQFSPDYIPHPCDGAYTMGETEDYTISIENCFEGNGCTDGDVCTINDLLDANCLCSGTEITMEEGGCNLINVPVFTEKTRNLNTTQFYSCAIHPERGNHQMIAGAQDNGTQYFFQEGVNSTLTVFGGDGGFCFIDQDEPHIQMTSYVYNFYVINSDSWGGNTEILEIGENAGRFINPMDYDSKTNTLYAAYNDGYITRIKNVGTENTFDTLEIIGLEASKASVFKIDPNKDDYVWVGSPDQLVLLSSASSEVPVEEKTINIRNFSNGGYLRSLEVEINNSDHILLTFTSYGVNKIWESKDGGLSWNSVDGNLPDMPVWWILFDPINSAGAIIATEMGVWKTNELQGSETTWEVMASGLGNVRCSMLKYRDSDKTLVVATYGRGLYSINLCPDLFVEETLDICQGETVEYGDMVFNQSGVYEFWTDELSSCDDSTFYTLNLTVLDLPVFELGDTISLIDAEEVSLSAGTGGNSYFWSNGMTTQSITLSGTELGVGEHIISVEVTTSAGCTFTDDVLIIVTMTSSTIDEEVQEMEIFPNPATELINFPRLLNAVQVFDAFGQKVLHANNLSTLNIQDFSSGVYFVTASENGKLYSGKFIKI